MKNVIIGTAGHIDHGKSALVEALTGTHPDRLEEERRRGITIDLGFAFLQTPEARLGFVDVPGHERFVKNMLAGVGGIDCVLLVIAADEGIKPQTREHFDICRLLEIPRGVVALTKSDLVDPEALELVRLEVKDFLRGSFLEAAPIVPVSAKTRAGLDELLGALVAKAGETPKRDPGEWFRLPIDRVFAVKGFGTVVTGTLVSGSVAPEDEVELFPAGRRLRVRGIESGGERVSHASAGQRTALNLASIEVGELSRGMVLAAPGHFAPTKRADARLALLSSARKPVANRARVHFHQGAAETIAEVILLGTKALKPGDSALCQLVFQEPIFLWPGDRFIVRQFSPVITIGGGKILDAQARKHCSNDECGKRYLETLDSGDGDKILRAALEISNGILSEVEIISKTAWSRTKIRVTAENLSKLGEVRVSGEQRQILALVRRVDEAHQLLQRAMTQFHAKNPLAEGIAKSALQTATELPSALFEIALSGLVSKGTLLVAGEIVKDASRSVRLKPEEDRLRAQIAAKFENAGTAPAPFSEMVKGMAVTPVQARNLMDLLLREKVLVRVSEDLIFHAKALETVRARLGEYKRKNGPRIGVPAFKEIAGVTRKHAIPILEFLDRTGVTQRQGDERVIL
jgi:selenocysteine-specific elongation factor